MFGPWLEVFAFLRNLFPDFSTWDLQKLRQLRPSKPNFIALHYMYLISMTIISSVIIYGATNMDYIDALFFGSGASTQSGLNTIDVNLLLLYQQVTIMLVACLTNPIFINTFVVFVRLYWFEKRFQHVVKESQKLRRTRERMSRSKSEAKADLDLEAANEGIRSKPIKVVNAGPQSDSAIDDERDEKGHSSTSENMRSDDSGSSVKSNVGPRGERMSKEEEEEMDLDGGPRRRSTAPAGMHRDIMFADEIHPRAQNRTKSRKRRDSSVVRLPDHRSADQHIAILEKQRADDHDETLYIPGPRDFDRGEKPQNLRRGRKSSHDAITRQTTNETFPSMDHGAKEPTEELNEDDHPPKSSHSNFANVRLGNPFASVGHSVYRHFTSRAIGTGSGRNTPDAKSGNETLRQRGRQNTFRSFLTTDNGTFDDMPYLSYQPTVGRNSRFVNLTEEQREELGGIEYRALKALAVILVCYFVGFHLLGLLSLLPWIVRSSYVGMLESEGINPAWWGVFTPASMFNDLGFTLTPDSMNSFNYAVWPLLIGSYLIIIGNTGFPCMLRFTIWLVSKFVRTGTPYWEELRFLLDHPRRCFTLLFPSTATWWLFWVLVLLNGIDLIFFIILDLHDQVVSALPGGIRVLDGWFQAASTRTAGFSVVNISALHPAIQVSYLIMMYISVFPIAISVRRTNVYEEKSLGLYHGQDSSDEENKSFVGTHLRHQLSFDLWYIFLGLFIISIVEGGRLGDINQTSFTLFSCLFEIVSAYGTVGLSLGYPNLNASFSAEFSTLSKLVIIAMQIRGRHRGLPYALDKAILLPSETSHKKEQEDAEVKEKLREARSPSIVASPLRRRPHEKNSMLSMNERTPTMATARDTESHSGNMGLGRLLSSALSAGPTVDKRD